MIEFWTVVTVVAFVCGVIGLAVNMATYNSTKYRWKKEEARLGVIKSGVAILTCWAWPVWLIIFVCLFIYAAVKIAVKG